MQHSLGKIFGKPSDYKICKKCGAINQYENKICVCDCKEFDESKEAFNKSLFQNKGFFLGDLFRKVIFTESELVGSSKKHEALMVWSQRVAYSVIAILTIGILFAWVGSVSRHETYKTQVESYLNEFNNDRTHKSGLNTGLLSMLPGLNALGKASLVYDQNNHPWLSGVGLYDGNINIAVDNAYQHKLKTLFLPKLLNKLEANLKQSHNTSELYNTFIIYLMFNKTEFMNNDLIRNWFESNWANSISGEGSQQDELKAHLNALLALPDSSFK